MINKKIYGLEEISKELIETASGKAYHGNALYVSQDIKTLTEEERLVIRWWLNNKDNVHSDVIKYELHQIALKLLN